MTEFQHLSVKDALLSIQTVLVSYKNFCLHAVEATMSEKRIKFISLHFSFAILNSFKPHGNFIADEKDSFILCMSWPWRAPDKDDFNSAFSIPATKVLMREKAPDNSPLPPGDQTSKHHFIRAAKKNLGSGR